jgi:DNA repair protein RecO (recombination protein O)
MQLKSKGIVLHQLKYSDTSLITTIYTSTHGRLSFLLQGARKKKAKLKANLFQPLFLLDLEMYYKNNRQLQKIKEANNAYPFQTIPYDFKKRTIALFLGEILYKTLHEEESNPYLFDFIYNHIKVLDLKESGLSNFHIYFLVQLTKHLGFFPQNNFNDTNTFFDLKNGKFVPFKPNHDFFMDKEESSYFSHFLSYSNNQNEEILIPRKVKMQILEKILEFYQIHNPGRSEIKSFEVLKEIFN